jgi:NDP-sugar pyrophosphorylase family protein
MLSAELVIMAGGLGTRLRRTPRDRQKCLTELGGKPFLMHLIDLYSGQGFERIHLCLGYGSRDVTDLIDQHLSNISFTLENTPLGTAGCLKNALEYLGERFVVVMGDSYTPELIAPHRRHWEGTGLPAAMFILENHDALVPSNVIMSDGLIVRYEKQDQPKGWAYVDYGIYLLQRHVIDSIPNGFVDLQVPFNELIRKRQLMACLAEEVFWEIGTPMSLARVKSALSDGRLVLGAGPIKEIEPSSSNRA